MQRRAILWLGGAVLYGAFAWWYTNTAGPLTDAEIEQFLARIQSNDAPAARVALIESFMRADTGRQFVMINLLDLNAAPPDLPATGDGAPADALLDHYMEYMYPAMLARASHPVFFGATSANALDLVGIDGAEHWTQGALIRYRSRRDIMEISTDPRFDERHDYKMAALAKTIAVPVEPTLYPADLRVLVGLALFSLVALIDLIVFRRQRN